MGGETSFMGEHSGNRIAFASIIVGAAVAVATMLFHIAYPDAPIALVRVFFWVSVFIVIAGIIYLIVEVVKSHIGRKKMFPVLVMIAGALIFSCGAIWYYCADKQSSESQVVTPSQTNPLGQGGKGGDAKTFGNNNIAIGGLGGGGGPGGKGGDGGGGEIHGDNSIGIGGEGGQAGQANGQGGRGGDSGFSQVEAIQKAIREHENQEKKVSPLASNSIGSITGNQGIITQGQVGDNTINQRIPPRTIPQDAQDRILSVLQKEEPSDVLILVSGLGGIEAQEYASQWATLFTRAGWKPRLFGWMDAPALRGMQIYICSEDRQYPPKSAQTLFKALRYGTVPMVSYVNTDYGDDWIKKGTVALLIGAQPE